MARTVHGSRCINAAKVLLLLACSAGLVQCSKNGPAGRQYDRTIDFGTYRTFAFENHGIYRPPAWLEAAVEDNITTMLASRGFKYEESTDADLLLSYQVSRKQRRIWQSTITSRGVPTYRPELYREALLILTLQIRDRKTDEVVWKSYAALPPTNDWKKVRSRIDNVVARILKKFPP